MCKQLCYVICVVLQTGSLDATVIVLQMCSPHRVLWGFITFSDFDWQICWGTVKNEPKLYRQQNVSHYLETLLVFCFSVGGQTHRQKTNEDHLQEKEGTLA